MELNNLSTFIVASDTKYNESAVQTWIALGKCSVALGMVIDARQCFEYAMNHNPLNVNALVGFAQALRMKDAHVKEASGIREAVERLNMSVEKNPHAAQSGEVFRELAECYLILGMVDQALHAVEAGIHIDSSQVWLWLLHGQALNRAGKKRQAAEKLNHCLSLLASASTKGTDKNVEVARATHAELAAMATTEGDFSTSISELETALALPPPPLEMVEEHISLWCALATAKERANDKFGALKVCETAEVIVGYAPRILLTHAYMMLNSPVDDENNEHYAHGAIQILESAIKSKEEQNANDEGDFLPWYLLGKAYSRLDEPRAAYDAYQVALRRAPKSPIPWLAIGKLYLQLNQLPDTLAAYSQALRLQVDDKSPATATAWDGLSCVYERSNGQLMDAADACNRAATCFRIAGVKNSADYFEYRAKQLQLASNREGPVPPLREAPDVPSSLLRDIVALLPSERIAFIQGTQTSHSPQQLPPQSQHASPAQNQQTPINNSTRTPQHQPLQPTLSQHYQMQPPYKQMHDSSPRQNLAPPHPTYSSNQQLHQQRQYSPNIPPPTISNPNQYPHYFYQQPPSNGFPPGVMPHNPQVISQPMGHQMAPGPPGAPPPPPAGYAYGQFMPMQGAMAYPSPANNWGK